MDIVERCYDYLSSGGLFNPELMDHEAVSNLVIDCRNEIERLRQQVENLALVARGAAYRIEDAKKSQRFLAMIDKVVGGE